MSRAPRMAPLLALVIFLVASFAAPALAQTYTISVQTNSPSYSGSQHIMTSGVVSPAPAAANTAVIVRVLNPNNATVDIEYGSVAAATGSYNVTTVAGGTVNWIAGRYLVNATWGGLGSSATATTTFQYSPSLAVTTTAVACNPATVAAGSTTQCTASVSGASGSISGETITFSQTGGTGSVTLPSPATCTLSGTSCAILVTGLSPGTVTIQASYPGDSNNAASSGNTTSAVTQATSTSTSAPPVSSSSTTTTTTTTTTTSTKSSSSSSSGGSASLTYILVAAIVVIVIVIGVLMWRRRVASSYGAQPTTK